jgi:5-methylcytosine-specific restriction endonuclease McrA
MAASRFRPAARVALFLAAGGRCAACGVALQPGWHADHVVPTCDGGATTPANGRALCPRCNLAKGARPA